MKHYLITDFGAVGNGLTDNSQAFKDAFSQEGEFRICIPEGIWLTGPFEMPSFSILHLEKGAVIRFIDDFSLYSPVFTRWEGVLCWCMHPCIYIHDAKNVSITGEGTIDGNGEKWWKETPRRKGQNVKPESEIEKTLEALNGDIASQPSGGGGRLSQFLRPPLIQFNGCSNIMLQGVSFINSPFWTVHPLLSKDVCIRGIQIINPYLAPNTDGIDIDSCTNVIIEDCIIDVGDDGICIKSGSGPDGIKVNWPTENVQINNCLVKSAHGGVVIGSETAAGISNVKASNCTFEGTDRGIRIKTRRGRGGVIKNLFFSNISMSDCLCPITINMYYRCGTEECSLFSLEKVELTDCTPTVKDIVIENVTATGSKAAAAFFVGLPESPVTGVVLKNVNLGLDSKSTISTDEADMFSGLPHIESRAIRCRNVNLEMENVNVSGIDSPIYCEGNCSIKKNS